MVRFNYLSLLIFAMNRMLLVQLVLLFIITQAIGLYVGNTYIKVIEEHPEARPTIVTDNPEDPINSIALFAYVLGFTAVLLIVIKFIKGRLLYWLFKAFESLAIFGTSVIVFAAFYDNTIVILFALILVALRNIYAKNLWLRNASSVIAVAGAGALIGITLGIFPILIFMVVLAVYDLIAVFKTKHMVTLAKSIVKKNLSFTYALPTKEHTFELGTGDMVIPLTFAVSVLAATKVAVSFPYYWIPPVAILLASLIGLLWTIDYVSKRVGKALPALPPQTVLMLVTYGLLKLAGF